VCAAVGTGNVATVTTPPQGPTNPHRVHGSHGGGVHNRTVNALVAHLEEGLEIVHLYSGRTLCQLHLPAGQLHADINGDGVMDHIQVGVIVLCSKQFKAFD
jgi:hypothetical protein